jgi:glycosyltransferase involved in cell wall biosynthesis
MASDCPVVCSRVAGIPEVAGEAALFFDPHDPEDMADAMHRILTDEKLGRSLVQAGRDRCRQFSWERTARETLKVLEEAALVGARHLDRRSAGHPGIRHGV